MKFAGNKISEPKPQVVVIIRPEGEMVFVAKAVLNYQEFETLYPEPRPPLVSRPTGAQFHETTDPRYLDQMRKRNLARHNWMFIKSLQGSPGLEWETIDYNNPDTWSKFNEELENSNLTTAERNRVLNAIMQANSMDEDKMEEARKRFLATTPGLQPSE